MTEQQRYQVVRQGPGFELRRYPAHLVAEVDVQASVENAGTAAKARRVSRYPSRVTPG